MSQISSFDNTKAENVEKIVKKKKKKMKLLNQDAFKFTRDDENTYI